MLKRILIVDDEKYICASLKGGLEDEGFAVETAIDGIEGVEKLRKFAPDIVFLDIWMPKEDGLTVLGKIKKLDPLCEVVVMSGHGTIETAVKAIKLGAYDFIEKPINLDKVMLLLRHAFDLKMLKRENRFLREELVSDGRLIVKSAAMKKLIGLVETAAPSNGWVLLHGEDGTGRELVAKALHAHSERRDRRFVTLNCATASEKKRQEDLFGVERVGKGEPQLGKLEQADGGTLFLEEVQLLDRATQKQLLRYLQEMKVTRLRGNTPIPVDVRIIASTRVDLAARVNAGDFEEELFYRLSVIPIRVPPLRDRPADVPALVDFFLERYRKHRNQKVKESTLKHMQAYEWPGNVRELKNWVERSCLLSEGDDLQFEDYFLEKKRTGSFREAKAWFERDFIESRLREFEGNVSKTAQAIGLERSHLHKKIKTYGIESVGTA